MKKKSFLERLTGRMDEDEEILEEEESSSKKLPGLEKELSINQKNPNSSPHLLLACLMHQKTGSKRDE